jgi:mRNA interferase MazF
MAHMPGNVQLATRITRLPFASVANVSEIMTIDRDDLTDRVSLLPRATLGLILKGIDVMLGRT